MIIRNASRKDARLPTEPWIFQSRGKAALAEKLTAYFGKADAKHPKQEQYMKKKPGPDSQYERISFTSSSASVAPACEIQRLLRHNRHSHRRLQNPPRERFWLHSSISFLRYDDSTIQL